MGIWVTQGREPGKTQSQENPIVQVLFLQNSLPSALSWLWWAESMGEGRERPQGVCTEGGLRKWCSLRDVFQNSAAV